MLKSIWTFFVDGFDIGDIISSVVALIAVFVSISANNKQEKRTAPYCRIKTISFGYSFQIQVENVGTGVMRVNQVFYAFKPEKIMAVVPENTSRRQTKLITIFEKTAEESTKCAIKKRHKLTAMEQKIENAKKKTQTIESVKRTAKGFEKLINEFLLKNAIKKQEKLEKKAKKAKNIVDLAVQDSDKKLNDIFNRKSEIEIKKKNPYIVEYLNDMKINEVDLTKIFRREVYDKGQSVRGVYHPYKSQTGDNLNGDTICPNSIHYMFRAEFTTMNDLLSAWEFAKNLDVYIDFFDVHGKRFLAKSKFEKEYISFISAVDGREDFLHE